MARLTFLAVEHSVARVSRIVALMLLVLAILAEVTMPTVSHHPARDPWRALLHACTVASLVNMAIATIGWLQGPPRKGVARFMVTMAMNLVALAGSILGYPNG